MKKLLILITVTLCTLVADAQQDIMLSQYMFNTLLINPGYAGSKDYMMATLLYRKQWTGFDGSPETETATIHGPLRNKHFGLGFTLINDEIGVTKRTSANAVFAYQMDLNSKLKLGLGIQGGATSYTYKTPSVVWDQGDPLYDLPPNKTLPNFGWGAYLYAEKYYFGISVPHLLDHDSTQALNSYSTETEPRETRHYFVTGGYVFNGNPDVVVKPSILMKYVHNAPVEFDLNVNVMFVNTFWLGVSYRTQDAIIGIVEIQLSKRMRLGYAYDYALTDIQKYSNGSHEIMLGYDFGYDVMKMKTPRYF